MNRILTVTVCLLSAAFAAAAEPAPAPAQTAELSRHFGFGPMQIYRLKSGIRLLELADLDGDGRTDILLWNPHDSRIELFYQRNADSPPESRRALDRNELPDRGDMHNERLPVSYQVSAMCVAELTGDGRPDLVFFGEPREIVILPGQPDGGFGPPSGLRAPEGEPRAGFLCVGDFNSDGLTDVALLGREVLQIYHQQPDGGLAQPLRLVHGVTDPMLMLTTDIDGDGRDDLAIVVDDVQYAMNVYLQGPDGTLSALQRVKIPRLRSATFVPAPGGDHLFAIEAATRRLTQYVWQARTDGVVELDWPQRLYSYPVAVKARRIPFALGDVTNDGLVDCVAADPDAAQLFLFAGLPDGLGAGKAFPGLAKTTDLLIADLDGDGQAELVSVSAQERTLGVSRFEHGRLTFPQPLPTPGTPLAVTAGRLRPTDERLHLAIAFRPVTADEQRADDGDDEDEDDYADERGTSQEGIYISLVDPTTHRELRRWPVPDLTEDPSGLRLADVNQDGRNDLIVFSHFNPPQVFLQAEDGQFRLLTGFATRASLVREARLPSFDLADVTGDGQPELLLAQQGLARALRVADDAWTVVDQYNPEAAGAEITGLAALPGEPGSPTLAMYDRRAREVLLLDRRADQAYSIVHKMPVGDYDVAAMDILPIGAERRPALLLADARKLSLFLPGAAAPTFVAQHSYETEAKDAQLGDCAIGDLNGDGVRDIAAVDMRKGCLEVLTTLPDGDLAQAVRFQVFEGKRFADDPGSYGEPREVRVADVTGDGIDDIVVLVHDRLIIYPGQ
jgi:hypothetical protein